MLQTPLQAVNSAYAAAIGMHERNIQNLTNIPLEEEPLMRFNPLSKTLLVSFDYVPYYFEEFTSENRPKKLKEVFSITKFSKCSYTVVCQYNSDNDRLYSELESLVLPF